MKSFLNFLSESATQQAARMGLTGDGHGGWYDAKGKFGRILGDIIVDKVSMSETMIKEHHAVPYYGQSKEEIAESHIKNRALVKI